MGFVYYNDGRGVATSSIGKRLQELASSGFNSLIEYAGVLHLNFLDARSISYVAAEFHSVSLSYVFSYFDGICNSNL
jgi:hypothetical protein